MESPRTAKWPLPFVLVFGLTITRAADPIVTIDTASPSGKVSPLFYGLMTEEIKETIVPVLRAPRRSRPSLRG